MRRVSALASVLNVAMTPALNSRKDPDRSWAKIVAAAEQEQGRTFDDDRQWLDDLRFAFGCYAEVEGMAPMGWVGVKAEFAMRLTNRLRVRRLHAEHPEIADEPIENPVFILGLPRTATTLTHKILAGSPGHRGPLTWEMYNIDLELPEKERNARIGKVARDLSMLEKLMPVFPIQHPMVATGPEESFLIVPHTHYHLTRAPIPHYAEWLETHDRVTDYAYLKESLQVLQYGRERKRWIMKSPMDTFNLREIQTVFPDATFVWNHRDPVTVIASTCSLNETAMGLMLRRVDRHALGRRFLDLLADGIARAREARPFLRPGSVIDVPYHRLNADPYTYVPELYAQIGAQWGPKDEANLQRALERPVADRRHEYALADYGLTHADVDEAFGDYIKLVALLN
ncbi:sulfotransferase family protein [Glycomyces paridis]|uniref:Sulfotransferase n=1 Tax=Glycomyces paridis TaxID=2126555 RepID=A0A4S8PHX7_9ACTN|nr:sulfotransferase [Glycomyces paridis]THV29022.1 sulfotransferase [Glycomyces paridis]